MEGPDDMTLFNVHYRTIKAGAADVGSLIDQLATPTDPLWPWTRWPAMRFDRPGITEGAVGGHGPVGYRVKHHAPGRSVTFEFTDRPRGLRGHHQFVVQESGSDVCVLWHITDVALNAPTRWTWRIFWAPLHNALIEDALARALSAFESDVPTPTWSRYVRLLRVVVRLAGVGRAADLDRKWTEGEDVAHAAMH